ncbi:hypothetical protein SAMN04488698_107109 [Candidatus Frackibacter sp. WG12]|nr:hypothetical protein SAMN04515661_1078 [Candidatus Frackibacter sp. WG11]SEM57843.1 hypothetical protein SAMN04488698_107109 [Candidatus Frackibacter sp. WG12]SFM09576.1 hypothetical protein SAMN04488699_13615 [Candidatus Frackibacter sp. WG13]
MIHTPEGYVIEINKERMIKMDLGSLASYGVLIGVFYLMMRRGGCCSGHGGSEENNTSQSSCCGGDEESSSSKSSKQAETKVIDNKE